jgi:hypothetical protein
MAFERPDLSLPLQPGIVRASTLFDLAFCKTYTLWRDNFVGLHSQPLILSMVRGCITFRGTCYGLSYYSNEDSSNAERLGYLLRTVCTHQTVVL